MQADFTTKQGSVVPDGSSDAHFVAVSILMLSWFLLHCTIWLGVNSFAFSFWTLFSLRSYISTSLAPSSCSSLLYCSSFCIRTACLELPQSLLPACKEQLFSGMAPPASPTPARTLNLPITFSWRCFTFVQVFNKMVTTRASLHKLQSSRFNVTFSPLVCNSRSIGEQFIGEPPGTPPYPSSLCYCKLHLQLHHFSYIQKLAARGKNCGCIKYCW